MCLPELFNVVATHVHEHIAADISAISFTTDIWSSDVRITSMLSLTAQWIDADFQLQKILLHSQELRGSHTAAAISDAFSAGLFPLAVYARSVWNSNKTVPARREYAVEQHFLNVAKPLCAKASLGCI